MSSAPSRRTTLRAAWLFPGNGKVLRDVVLTLEADLILDCRSGGRTSADIDLGHAAIIPPLVNAHTHLEFSDLDQPIAVGTNFAVWLNHVINQRATRRQHDPTSSTAMLSGLAQTRRYGCLRIGEIATATAVPMAPRESPVGGVQFLELIGVAPDRVAAQMERAQEFLRSRQGGVHDGFRPALSPHAPYSTSMSLVQQAVALAETHRVAVAMHLAETPEEIQLLTSQQGPLVDFLSDRKIWPPRHVAADTCAMDYLHILAAAPRALVIHGNYLQPGERTFIANQPQMSLVYCPRTHAFFGHPKYPLAETIAAGARVVLGTDSRASNPDLNIWAEAQFVARHHTEVRPAKVLELVTTAAAAALGDPSQRVEPGQPGTFAVIAGLPTGPSRGPDPFADLLASSTYPARVWSGGSEIRL